MGRKAKRLKVLKRIERLTAKADQPIPVVSNSEMQEKMKEQKVDVAPDTNFNAEIVEKLIEEAEELVVQVEENPRPKPKPKRQARKRSTTKARSPRKTKKEE